MSITRLRRLILLGNLAVVGAGCWAAGSWFWRNVLADRGPGKKLSIPREPAAAPKDQKLPFDKFNRIWDSPWVHSQQPNEVVKAPVVGPETPKGLTVDQLTAELSAAMKLLWTYPNHTMPHLGVAAVNLSVAGQPDSRLVGFEDVVRGKYKVVRVDDGAVFFETQGVIAPLNFARGPNIVEETLQGKVGRAREIGIGVGEGAGPAGEARPSGDEVFVIQAKKISDVLWEVTEDERRYLQNNTRTLLSEVDFAPHVNRTTGKSDGIELRKVAPNSLVAKRGFEAGDVIKSVNGDLVDSMTRVPELIAKHREARELVVVYLRRGVETTVTYKVKK